MSSPAEFGTLAARGFEVGKHHWVVGYAKLLPRAQTICGHKSSTYKGYHCPREPDHSGNHWLSPDKEDT